ncbi:P-loop containing nucleoside triphosphate hydrolase protein [Lipomyces arxii]|uniref:P-loop containing nucleoside triphosphate hydrolase protein n=1 Tax=Lipomyces arxii TaxID=56418 RepID=UPI0034CD6F53
MSETLGKRKRLKSKVKADQSETGKHASTLEKYRAVVSQQSQNTSASEGNTVTEGNYKNGNDAESTDVTGLVPLPQPSFKKQIKSAVKDSWMVDPIYVKPTVQKSFNAFGLSSRMIKNLAQEGFINSFAVQSYVIPMIMTDANDLSPDVKGSILVNAATGSGKTLAYGIPIVEALSNRIVPRIRAVVILPTKPLVQQVRAVLETLARGTSLRTMALRSDRPLAEEQTSLSNLIPDIVITTPGRLVDHVRLTPSFDLQSLRYIVIDEADRLLNQSFQEWVSVLLGSIYKTSHAMDTQNLLANRWSVDPQYLIFSATLTKDAGKWADLKLRRPRIIIVGEKPKDNGATQEEFAVPFTLTEYIVSIPEASMKPLLLLNLLLTESIQKQCIIFTRSNETAARLAKLLAILDDSGPTESRAGFRIGLATGEIDQTLRKKALREFAAGDADIIICTDIIARGMDIESIQHVINYDIPLSAREYVHRVGRTARAGKAGSAWSLVSRPEAKWFKQMAKTIKRSKEQKLIKKSIEIWEGQEEQYESALSVLERQVKGL